MALHRAILEMGAGNDLHGGDYTKAAIRAVEDALHHSSLTFIRALGIDKDTLQVDVTIGVQKPDEVDTEKVKGSLPVGKISVRAVKGGLDVEDEIVGEIDHGLVALIGVTHDDTPARATKLAEKIANLRIFEDDAGKMNRSAIDVGGGILTVSQFTLYGDTRKGRRPGYSEAARPEQAEPLVDRVVEELRAAGAVVATGRFRTDMAVELVNDGPITLSIEV